MRPHNVVGLSPRRHSTAQLEQPRLPPVFRYDPSELEFSEYGRDPRFLPGWWIVPMCLLSVLNVCIGLSVYLR